MEFLESSVRHQFSRLCMGSLICLTTLLDTVHFITLSHTMSDPSDLLKSRNIPVTAQRLAVIKAVSNRPHCTADDIAEEVRSEIGTISRQAVYNVLGVLSENGIIRRIQPAGSPARYEDRVGDNHHHLVCRKCASMVDVDCAVGYTPCLNASHDSGYRIDEAEVIYWGLCPTCLEKATQPNKAILQPS